MKQQIKFDPQWVEPIRHGDKTQTVRKNTTCEPGDVVDLINADTGDVICDVCITGVSHVRIDSTSMRLNGQALFAFIHDRDQWEPTDTEFAQACGHEDYCAMSSYIDNLYGLPFEGVAIKWEWL